MYINNVHNIWLHGLNALTVVATLISLSVVAVGGTSSREPPSIYIACAIVIEFLVILLITC